MDQQNPASGSQPNADASIFENSYYSEVQQDIWQHERKKTSTSLLFIGGILLAGDILGLYVAGSLTATTLLFVLVVPAIYFGLGVMARYKPMPAVILGCCLFGIILAYNIYMLGGQGIFSGWFIKAVIIFLIFRAFGHAKDAEEARKNLQILT